MDTEEIIGIAVEFIRSFEISQWFDDLDLTKKKKKNIYVSRAT